MVKELETRKCTVTGKLLKKEELLRFVVLNDGSFLPDFNKKLGGKGIYVSNSKRLLQDIVNKNSLLKIARKKIKVPEDLPEMVEKILAKKGLDAINLARKAGNLICGFEKVKEAIIKGKVSFVIEAADAGADGKQKIAELTRNIEKFTLYDVATLDVALDKNNTVYSAVIKGETSEMVRLNLKKYQTFLNA